jgi:hypothetical protein
VRVGPWPLATHRRHPIHNTIEVTPIELTSNLW